MKSMMAVFILILNVSLFAQDPLLGGWSSQQKEEAQISVFPDGFNPDGKIGNFIVTAFAGLINQSYDLAGDQSSSTGLQFSTELIMPIDQSSSLFLRLNYANESRQSFEQKIWSVGAGIRLFGGMNRK